MNKKRLANGLISRRKFLQAGLGAALGVYLPMPLKMRASAQDDTPLYLDTAQPIDARVSDLISRMTLEEKVAQMSSTAPGIERLNVPPYNWWNEALHGVGRAGIATVFPQAIGIASTWNPELIQRMANVISDEGRAKHHEAVRQGIYDEYTGLTFWSPNINIFRDPRWGRGQETYGEDPYLTARIGVSFVRGLQGDDPTYFKTIATAKHFAVHSGPEVQRHYFNALVSQRDLHMTYLPAFKALITEAKAYSIMGAYNQVNGEACCASPFLLQETLRESWGFEGYVVSDCGAITDIYANHLIVKTAAEAAALAVKTGCDLECCETYGIPCTYDQLPQAINDGLLSEDYINTAVTRLFTARFRLGMFDPPEMVSYTQIPYSVVDSEAHRQVALEVAQQSLVLLKNENNLLPLDKSQLKSIAVIGPNADDTLVLTANYMGTPSEPVTVLAGIRAALPDAEVYYARGCDIVGRSQNGYAEAVEVAQKAQVAVMVMGLSQLLEGEQGQQEGNPPGIVSAGDRGSALSLTPIQQALLETVQATGTPMVLVLINGSMVAVEWADENIPAILEAWYPGQAGGTAVASALFGDYNPGGRLPVTFYRLSRDLPQYGDYSMDNRTYRYFTGDPLYKFGYGLSYTSFAYRDLKISAENVAAGDSVTVSVEVENSGEMDGDEVVQLYLQDVEASSPVPQLHLEGFKRIHLAGGEKQTVTFTISPEQLSFYDDAAGWTLQPGTFRLWVGGQQPNLQADTQPENVLGGQFEVV